MSGFPLAKIAVFIVLAIYGAEWAVYHIKCHPSIHWALLFNAVLALAIWSYLATALTDPGTPATAEWAAWTAGRPKIVQPPTDEEQQADTRLRGWKPGQATWCRKCQCERPERAHHCAQCASCVLRMDHHCPWIGGCVGWRNHKYFVLLNWWSFWASLVFLLTLRRPNALSALDIIGGAALSSGVLSAIGVLAAFLFLLITGGMFIASMVMGSKNITAVEELFSGENPYRMSCMENFRQILGPFDWRLLVPLPPERAMNGTSYPLGKATAVVAEEGLSRTGAAAEEGASGAGAERASSSRKPLTAAEKRYGTC